MEKYITKKIIKLTKIKTKNKKVLLFGVTYKSDVADIRNSIPLNIWKNLKIKYKKKIDCVDSCVDKEVAKKNDISVHVKKEKYDYVVIVEVLEHLHLPHLAISNIYSLLNHGGKIILTVPFIFPIHERPYDYFRYTKYGLEFLFKDFSNLQIKERNSWLEAINVLFVRLVMDHNVISRVFAQFVIILAFINFPFVWIFSKILKTDFITTGYLLTAEKD